MFSEYLKKGKPIILCDAKTRENEGDLIFPAQTITAENINFMLQHCSGIICLTLTPEKAKVLDLPLMIDPKKNTAQFETQFTVSIEAKTGVSTGVSAADRARTIQIAASPSAVASDLARPGHVFPLIANPLGVLGRQGHTEGSVDLMRLAGLEPSAVLCELMNKDGTMMKGANLEKFSKQYDIPIVFIDQLYEHQMIHQKLIEEMTKCDITLSQFGAFQFTIFKNTLNHKEHIVLSKPSNNPEKPLVRIHSSCLTGDLFGSMHCDCRSQLYQSLEKISQKGGFLIYLNQEGRGIGLSNKIKAYALQQELGLDTVEANHQLGFSADERKYHVAGHILKYYGVQSCRLLTNNPCKIEALKKYDISVQRISLKPELNTLNKNYLKTKINKLNHVIEELSLQCQD